MYNLFLQQSLVLNETQRICRQQYSFLPNSSPRNIKKLNKWNDNIRSYQIREVHIPFPASGPPLPLAPLSVSDTNSWTTLPRHLHYIQSFSFSPPSCTCFVFVSISRFCLHYSPFTWISSSQFFVRSQVIEVSASDRDGWPQDVIWICLSIKQGRKRPREIKTGHILTLITEYGV